MNATASLITIRECTTPTELYRQYQGQSEPQPAYIALDLESGTMWASYDAIVGSGTPEEVHSGRERWYNIPLLTGDAANALMRRLAPLAERVIADSDVEFNDSGNRVGILGPDAQAAEQEIDTLTGNGYDGAEGMFGENELVSVWDVDSAVNGSEAEEYGITSTTTDERLDEIAAAIVKDLTDASESGVAVVAGLDTYLTGLRDDLLEQDKTVYWSLMGGQAPGVAAVRPETAGITIPAEVIDWASAQGFGPDQPDLYLLLAVQEEAEEMVQEIDFMAGRLSDTDAALLRTALIAQAAERAEQGAPSEA